MVFDGIINFIVSIFDVIIDLIPNSGLESILQAINFTEFEELFANVLYFIPGDVITFFLTFCLPVVLFCLVIGVVRLILEVIPLV